MLKILTLNWNGKDKLERLYPTLINCLDGLEYEWHIKDNASKDGSIEYIESLNNKNIKLYKWEHNRDSFAVGMNILFEKANCGNDDLILMLNNDLYFEGTTSIKDMIRLIHKDNVGLVGARILYPGTNRLQHAGVTISKKNSGYPYHYKHGEECSNDDCLDREFQIVTAACALTKAEYYRQVCTNKNNRVGFCEEYFWMYEDVDFALAIKYNLGKKVIYCGSTNIFHEESASLKKNPVHKMMMQSNFNVYRRKWSSVAIEDHDMYLNNKDYGLYE